MFLNTSFISTNVNGGSYSLVNTLNPDGNPNDLKLYLPDTITITQSADVTRILNAFSVLRNAKRTPAGNPNNRPNGITNVRLFRNWEIFTATALRVDGSNNNSC